HLLAHFHHRGQNAGDVARAVVGGLVHDVEVPLMRLALLANGHGQLLKMAGLARAQYPVEYLLEALPGQIGQRREFFVASGQLRVEGLHLLAGQHLRRYVVGKDKNAVGNANCRAAGLIDKVIVAIFQPGPLRVVVVELHGHLAGLKGLARA
nr:hypothetical protein [Tanacetum cinerariifolium]